MLNVSMDFTENHLRNTSGFQDSSKNTGSIEVGVIIMGVSCVCVVACALIILQVRSVNRQRQRRRRQRSSTVSIMRMEEDDPYQSYAPPTYEAVIRSPHLYPPSPRSSVASVISISSMRRGSSTSNLSKVSAIINSCSRDSPTISCATQNRSNSTITIEDLEDPPPPYPGILASTYTDLDNHVHSRTNDACDHGNSCHSNSEGSETLRNVAENISENQTNSRDLQSVTICNNVPANTRRNRSSSHGNEIQRDIRSPSNSYHRNSVHSIGGNHNDLAAKNTSICPGRGRADGKNNSNDRSGRTRSVSVVCTSNFLLPSQAWDHHPRELSFVSCQSNSPTFGTSPSQNC